MPAWHLIRPSSVSATSPAAHLCSPRRYLLIVTCASLSFPLTELGASKLSGQACRAQPSPPLLSASGAAGTTSAKGRGNLTSVPLLRSPKHARTTAALWPAALEDDSHNQPTAFSAASLLPGGVGGSPPRSSGFPSLFCGCGFTSGHITRSALAQGT